jgi:hypothetical protein
MKKIFFIFFIFSFSILAAQTVNGDTLTVHGKKILKIWGTHSERGFAHGYLMGDKIKLLADLYIVNYVYSGSPVLYNSVHTFFLNSFNIEQKYQDEAQGIIDGMIAAEIDLYNPVLQRDFNRDDILMINSLVDLIAYSDLDLLRDFGCSSLSAWGENTASDPQLQGDLVITRQLDWTPHNTLHDNHLMIIHFPAENDEVNWLSFGFPGFFCALSGINEEGQGAFMNVGNNHSHPIQQNLHPILLSVRNGLESYDYNGDFQTDAWDVANAIQDKTHYSGSIINAVNHQYALIIETNNQSGTMIREDSSNTMIPLDALVATNHFQTLYLPIYCVRYQNISDSLAANNQISVDRSWNILKGASGVNSNLQMIEFAPNQNIIKWSTSKYGQPAYTNDPAEFEISELFTMPVSVDNQYVEYIHVVKIFPNPFFEFTSLSFSLSQSSYVELSIFNVRGQKIKTLLADSRSRGSYSVYWDGCDENGQMVPSGIYVYRFSTNYMSESGRLILVK